MMQFSGGAVVGGTSWFGDLVNAAQDSFTSYLNRPGAGTVDQPTPTIYQTPYRSDPFSDSGPNYQMWSLVLAGIGVVIALFAFLGRK